MCGKTTVITPLNLWVRIFGRNNYHQDVKLNVQVKIYEKLSIIYVNVEISDHVCFS
jgi:hypothetical protein